MAGTLNLFCAFCTLILLTLETTAYPKPSEDIKPPYTAPGGNIERLTEESRRNAARITVTKTSTTIPSTTAITTSTEHDLIPSKLTESDNQDNEDSKITPDMESHSQNSAQQSTQATSQDTEPPTTTPPPLAITEEEFNPVLNPKENDSPKPEELTEYKSDDNSKQTSSSASLRCKAISLCSVVLLFVGHFIIL